MEEFFQRVYLKKPVVKPFKGFSGKPKRYSIYIVCTHRLVHILRCVAYCFDFRNYNPIYSWSPILVHSSNKRGRSNHLKKIIWQRCQCTSAQRLQCLEGKCDFCSRLNDSRESSLSISPLVEWKHVPDCRVSKRERTLIAIGKQLVGS